MNDVRQVLVKHDFFPGNDSQRRCRRPLAPRKDDTYGYARF